MTDVGNRAVLLSGHELLLLLFKRNAEGIVLPEEISALSADEKELKEAMAELITDKYLLPGDDGLYKIAPEIRHFMDILTGASAVYVIEEIQRKFEPCYLYRTNMDAVSLNMDVHHKSWVRLESIRFEEKIKELLEFPLAKIQIQRFKAGDTEPDKVMEITYSDSLEEALDKMLEA